MNFYFNLIRDIFISPPRLFSDNIKEGEVGETQQSEDLPSTKSQRLITESEVTDTEFKKCKTDPDFEVKKY